MAAQIGKIAGGKGAKWDGVTRSLADFEGNDMTGWEARGVFFCIWRRNWIFTVCAGGVDVTCVRYLAKLHLNGMKCVLEIGWAMCRGVCGHFNGRNEYFSENLWPGLATCVQWCSDVMMECRWENGFAGASIRCRLLIVLYWYDFFHLFISLHCFFSSPSHLLQWFSSLYHFHFTRKDSYWLF